MSAFSGPNGELRLHVYLDGHDTRMAGRRRRIALEIPEGSLRETWLDGYDAAEGLLYDRMINNLYAHWNKQ